MKELFTPSQKQLILTQYSTRRPTPSFHSLADEYKVAGGHKTISRWHAQWNGTIASLLPKKRSSRPRILNKSEVTRYVRQSIQRKNRSHQAVHYTELLPRVVQNSGREVSVRTLRRYGKQ